MIYVFLDTNILHQEGLSSTNMQILKKLIDSSNVKIYISDLVKKEFLSKRKFDSLEKLKDIQKNISQMTKKVGKSSTIYNKSKQIEKDIRLIEDQIEIQINEDFDAWLTEYQVEVIEFEYSKISEVIDDYFSGNGVFRKPKNRDDLIDAMINTSIDSLLSTKDKITVIIKDGAFKKYLNHNPDIHVLDSVSNFIELEINKTKLIELDKHELKVEKVKEFLLSSQFKLNLITYLENEDYNCDSIYLEDSEIESQKLKMTTFAERIELEWLEVADKLNLLKIIWFSDGNYSIQFDITTVTYVSYCTGYGEYMSCKDEPRRFIMENSMDGDGVCDLVEEWNIKLIGSISINIAEAFSLAEIKTHSNYLGTENNPFQIEVEISKAILL